MRRPVPRDRQPTGRRHRGGIHRWFLDLLEEGDLEKVLDIPDAELELAGNGAHEIRSWLAVAGAVAPIKAKKLAYEAVYPWITGVAVAEWETQSNGAASAPAESQKRKESLR